VFARENAEEQNVRIGAVHFISTDEQFDGRRDVFGFLAEGTANLRNSFDGDA
jgi:hypothetical protein